MCQIKQCALKLPPATFFLLIINILRKESPLKIMLLFGLESSSHSPDIHIFVNTLYSLFSIVSHCIRWSKINSEICDIIISRIKEHKIETWSVDTQLSKQYLYCKKKAEIAHQKLVSDPLGKGSKTKNSCRKRFRK